VLTVLRDRFELVDAGEPVPRPTRPHQLGVRIDGRGFLLTIPDRHVPADPFDRLDVNLLQDLILEPIFGVTNPRADKHLRFIADTGDDAAHLADPAEAWFLPYPASASEVMHVADTGRAMPPKSTYFNPKLPSGLVIRPLDSPRS
jgi:uncharacterized protein (DUF1015 family)